MAHGAMLKPENTKKKYSVKIVVAEKMKQNLVLNNRKITQTKFSFSIGNLRS